MRDAKGRFVKARPFKVGDRVRVINTDAHYYPMGATAEIIGYWCRRGDFEQGLRQDQIRLISPAPQPKAEEKKPCDHSVGFTRDTQEGPRYCMNCGAPEDRDTPDPRDAEIASLQSEVTSLKAEVEKARSEQERLEKSRKNWQEAGLTEQKRAEERAEAAEAKLSDIRALVRADELLRVAPEKNIPTAIQSVLDR